MSIANINSHDSNFGKITFYGAALEVTGSCHLLQANGKRILMDCGMRQGRSAARKMNNSDFDFDPADIDMVVLSHAHLDHSGALPKLVAGGFNGPIFCTEGTHQLLRVLLEDSYRLYHHDIEMQNKRRARTGRVPIEMTYSEADVKQTLSLCEPNGYLISKQISPGIHLNFYNAGHILGSAIVELKITKDASTKTLIFSGDLGNPDTSLMPDPTNVEHADIVLMESTYGDRNHRNQSETLNEFKDVIAKAEQQHGNILIPSFAVGRTQELLFQLGCLYQQGQLNGWHVFLDSPMAATVTRIYNQCLQRLDNKDVELMKSYGSMTLEQFLPCLTVSESVEESKLINDVKSKAIIIAGSGMCTGGRIKHHLKDRIWRDNTHLIFVGYQANGTLGRRLVDGEKTIKIFQQKILVKAEIHTIGGFSAHAGQSQLIDWAKRFSGKPKFCLVHGEQEAIIMLREQLQRVGIDPEIAVKGASTYF